jgi:hypothetical protein
MPPNTYVYTDIYLPVTLGKSQEEIKIANGKERFLPCGVERTPVRDGINCSNCYLFRRSPYLSSDVCQLICQAIKLLHYSRRLPHCIVALAT